MEVGRCVFFAIGHQGHVLDLGVALALHEGRDHSSTDVMHLSKPPGQ